jgi:hypothetical protein
MDFMFLTNVVDYKETTIYRPSNSTRSKVDSCEGGIEIGDETGNRNN